MYQYLVSESIPEFVSSHWLGHISIHKMCLQLMCVSCLVVSDSLRPHELYNLPGSSVHGISQARILEWVTISFSEGSSQPKNQTQVSCTTGRFFTTSTTWEALGIKQIEAKLEFGIISLLEMLDLTECAFKFVT